MNDSMQKKEWSFNTKEEWNFNTFAWADEQKLPGFGELLNSWLQVHQIYCNGCRSENSWESDFKERSQVGFLSNAGALIGGITLEEMAVEKQSGSGNGRNDLFLRFPKLNPIQDYFFEAKLGTIDLLQSKSWAEQFSRVMGEAIKDTGRLKDPNLFKSPPAKAVAVSFFTLISKDIANLDEKTSALLKILQEKQIVPFDGVALICFSATDFKKNQEEREKWTKDNDRLGLILVAKHVVVTK